MNAKYPFFFVILCGTLFSCSNQYYLRESKPSITQVKPDSIGVDSGIWKMIAPYKLKLDAQMNEVIASTSADLLKEQPEGTLNNFMADAIFWYAAKFSDKPIQAVVLNYGGVRIQSIGKGDITLGRIYELMPFDNSIDILDIKGEQIIDLCNLAARNGGWPVSGIRFTIQNNKAVNITIQGNPIVEDATYRLVTSDYLTNGGDKAFMLKRNVKRQALNDKIRDALIDYLKNKQTINPVKDGRITIAQP